MAGGYPYAGAYGSPYSMRLGNWGYPYARAYGSLYSMRLGNRGYPYAGAYGSPYSMRFGPTFNPLHQLAHQHGWARQRLATPVLHRFHEARRTNDSLKQHQAVAPHVERKAEQTIGRAPVHAPAAPPSAIEACRGRLEAWPCTAVLPDRHNGFPE